MRHFNFFDELAKRGKSKRTCIEYQRRINKWIKFLNTKHNGMGIYEAGLNELIDYKRSLLCDGRCSSTIKVNLDTVSIFYDYCLEYGLISKLPCSKDMLLVEQVQELEELSQYELKEIKKWIYQLHGDYRKAMLCMFSTGARPGDIVNLTSNDIVHLYGNVFIRTFDYNWERYRWIPVMDRVIAAELFASSLGEQKGKLFNINKRKLIRIASKLNAIRDDFHHYLFRYTHTKRLKRNNVPNHIIDYLYGEGKIPKEFKRVDDELHRQIILKHIDSLFDL
ncbi:hypothetical protein ACYATM_06600 [Lactobacillaceae bacterium Scapto_B20]